MAALTRGFCTKIVQIGGEELTGVVQVKLIVAFYSSIIINTQHANNGKKYY